jgi:hypothetical protein
MASWDITGSWAGEYAYDPTRTASTVPPSVRFTLTARQGWFGRFRGVIQDDQTSGVPDEAAVAGRVTASGLTFLKQYPAAYLRLGGQSVTLREWLEWQQGIRIDSEIAAQAIRYCGEYEPLERVVRGTWRVEAHCIRIRSGRRLLEVRLEALSGTWSMRRQLG